MDINIFQLALNIPPETALEEVKIYLEKQKIQLKMRWAFRLTLFFIKLKFFIMIIKKSKWIKCQVKYLKMKRHKRCYIKFLEIPT